MFFMYFRLPSRWSHSSGNPESAEVAKDAAQPVDDVSQSASIQRQKQIHQLRQLKLNYSLERRLFQ